MYLVLSRFSVDGVLYLTCIPSSLAWWYQHDVTSIAIWHGQVASWLLAIWHSLSLNHCLQFGDFVSLKLCLRFGFLLSLNAHWQFGNILLLSSNNRISSFYWIRGSKHCFLTSCSYLNCNFCFLVFLRNRFLLVYLCLSWLHGNPISRPIFSHLWYSEVPRCTCIPIFLAHMMHFLEARRL